MKYIVKDQQDNYQVIEVHGFIPNGIICKAPLNAESDDGPNIDIIDGVASINQDRKNTLLAAKAAVLAANQYKINRSIAYPDFREYLDGVVKGDQEQIQNYIDQCNAVKALYPKPE